MTLAPKPAPHTLREPVDALDAIAAEAAQCLNLGLAQRVGYLGVDGRRLAACCNAWPVLEGDWLRPQGRQAPAQTFLERRGLGRRILRSSVVSGALLHGQGLRQSRCWDLAGDIVSLTAVPALAPNLGAGPSHAGNTGDAGRELAA